MSFSEEAPRQQFTGLHIGGSSRTHVGNHYGDKNYYGTQERAPSPPKPFHNVPFPHDPDHVDRETISEQIKQKLAQPGKRVALVGLGGVGKSQLAIEYAHHTRSQSPDTYVFWLHASSTARLEQSVRTTLEHLKDPGLNDPKANVFELLRSWLLDKKQRRTWLIIIDNADDESILLQCPVTTGKTEGFDLTQPAHNSERYLDFFPYCDHGSVLVTTRNRTAALQIVYRSCIVNVEPMDKQHALALLEKKIGPDVEHTQEELLQLVTELKFMPLAMAQAAAYIRERAPRYSVEKYIKTLTKSATSRVRLLNQDNIDLRRDREADSCILRTWKISFEHIRQTRSTAADLLSLMSFFDRQAIQEYLLYDRVVQQANDTECEVLGSSIQSDDESEGSSFSVSSPKGFDGDVQILRDYSFISPTANPSAFEMHRLVQLATQKWPKANEAFDRWQMQFLCNLDDRLPTGKYENWKTWQTLLPHAQVAMDAKAHDQEACLRQATVFHKTAHYFLWRGSYLDAERMQKQALEYRILLLDDDHRDTIVSKVKLGYMNVKLQRYNIAKTPLEEALGRSQTLFGVSDEVTLFCMRYLAETYVQLGRFAEAEAMCTQGLEKCKERFGENSHQTAKLMSSLVTYMNVGLLAEAQELLEDTLKAYVATLGEHHPSTLMAMDNLSITLERLSLPLSAIELMRDCAERSSCKLGPSHPSTIERYEYLGDWEADWKARTEGGDERGNEDENVSVEDSTEISQHIGANQADQAVDRTSSGQ
ncbi:hypothetical protein Q7P37_002305 [Cladosporium fusiforme]